MFVRVFIIIANNPNWVIIIGNNPNVLQQAKK